jgi:hypothetical protein
MKSEADILPNSAPISSIDQSNTGNMSITTTEVSAGSKRLHVTNLPFRIRDSDLQEMFGVNCRTESYPGGARFFDKRVILLKIVIFL